MKRKRMPPEEFDEYQARFRYPNITMGWIHPDEVDQYLPKIESYLQRPKMAPYKQSEGPLSVTSSTIARRYATGRPIEQVYEIIAKSIRIFFKILEEACQRPTSQNFIELFCNNYTVQHCLCECLLIASKDDLTKWINQVEFLVSLDLSEVERDYEWFRVPYIKLLLAIGKKDNNEEILRLAKECYREDLGTASYQDECRIRSIAFADIEAVNKDMQERVVKLLGSERSRTRKKAQVSIANRFSYDLLLKKALALHRGIPIRFVDSGIPIWDFRIAQRSEIQKLLPAEVVARIGSKCCS